MKVFLALFLLFFIFGCNVLNNPKESDITLQIPLKISTKIPNLLYEPSPKESRQTVIKGEQLEDLIGKKTPTFELTQDFINMFFYTEEVMITNNKITNQVLKDIKQKCTNFPQNKICHIAKDEISYTIDEQFLQELKSNKYTAEDVNITKDHEIRFGDIEFIRYEEKNIFDYAIKIDFTDIIKDIYGEDELSKIVHLTAWSKDKKEVLSTVSLTDNHGVESSFTINYEETTGEKEKMYLFYEEQASSINHISIANFFDKKQTTKVLIDFALLNSTVEMRYASFVKVNNQDGVQIAHIKNDIDSNKSQNYSSTDIIDSNGLLKASTFCFEDDDICQMNDIKSWYVSTENVSIFLPLVDNHEIYRVIDIENTHLSDGSYFFIPSVLYSKELTFKDVLKDKVGEFIVMHNSAYGIWSAKNYTFDSANLTLLRLNPNQKLDSLLKKVYFSKVR